MPSRSGFRANQADDHASPLFGQLSDGEGTHYLPIPQHENRYEIEPRPHPNHCSSELLFNVVFPQDTLSVFLWTGERQLLADHCLSRRAASRLKLPRTPTYWEFAGTSGLSLSAFMFRASWGLNALKLTSRKLQNLAPLPTVTPESAGLCALEPIGNLNPVTAHRDRV
jgi:hypothetical protein